jgi:hypothetical protein
MVFPPFLPKQKWGRRKGETVIPAHAVMDQTLIQSDAPPNRLSAYPLAWCLCQRINGYAHKQQLHRESRASALLQSADLRQKKAAQ